jgi:[ribosomal protein S18]-alanine N-acetyltransferase
MNPGVRLEPLRWWDIEDLLPIEADLFGVEKWSAAMFWNELANGNLYLVVRNGTGIVGYAGLSVSDAEAWVQNIAVRRDRQRQGLGRLLLEALLAEASARGAKAVLLEVAVDNLPAQRLYTDYGFETVGVRKGYYQPTNTDALVMRRDG